MRILLILLTIFFINCAFADTVSENSPLASEPVLPIPLSIDIDLSKVALGKRLFEDKKLSKDGTMACRSCHFLDKGGTDNKRFSPSIDGGYRARNTPTIFNLGLYELYGWYGFRKDLGDLAEEIIKSKKGLASDWPAIIRYLKNDKSYVSAFSSTYPKGIIPENIKDALAQYMRSLITPNSRFDHYLRGVKDAVTEDELQGYLLFKDYGCASCHQGTMLGTNMNTPFNIYKDFLKTDWKTEDHELGRYNKTGDIKDRYIFRVPSLRNIALTAPYFHDGSADNLDTAVDTMGRYMLGRIIPDKDRHLIVKFLKTLTGEYQGNPL